MIIWLMGCETKTPILSGELVELPRPFAAKECLDQLKLTKLGISYDEGVSKSDEIHYPFSWRDTSLSHNGRVVGGTYFGNFVLRLKNAFTCDSWMGMVDSIQLDLGSKKQILPIEKFAIFLHNYRKPEIRFFGNDTTYLQGFTILLSGFSGATGNTVYDYYLLNTETGDYELDSLLSTLPRSNINLETGIVSTGWNGGAAGRLGGMTYYRYTENRELEFLSSWHSDYSEDSREIFLVKYRQNINGRKEEWEELVAYDDWPPGNWR